MEKVVADKMLQTPYLLVIGNYVEQLQVFLVVDSKIIMEVTLENCVLILLSSYFVFNICYPKGCYNVFSFLELMFFKSTLDKLAPSVKQFYACLQSC